MARTDCSLREVLAGDGDVTREAFRETLLKALEGCEFCFPSPEYWRTHGIYDYGPYGCRIKNNLLRLWTRQFAPTGNILEFPLGPFYPDRYTVLMFNDEKTGTVYRADHLLRDFCNETLQKDSSISAKKAAELKEVLEILYCLSNEELAAKIKEYGITAPNTKNPLSCPYTFKLKLETPVGPSGFQPGSYARRRETAQDNFALFRSEFKYNALPCAVAEIGKACREEISPSRHLVIVQKSTVAQIHHFVDPEDKTHWRFSEVADVETFVFPMERQMSGQSSIKSRLGVAVLEGTVNNETLGYFIGRVFLFLTSLGIDKDRLRFRQRLRNEMAPYATDCWAAEIECSYGWIECVEIEDRPAYDLQAHAKKSGVALLDNEKLTETREEVEKSGVALLDNEKLTETREEEKSGVALLDTETREVEKSGVALLDNEKLIETREEVEKSGVTLHDNETLTETREVEKSGVALLDTESRELEKSGVALLDNEKLIEIREEVEKSGVALHDNEKLTETREEVEKSGVSLLDNETGEEVEKSGVALLDNEKLSETGGELGKSGVAFLDKGKLTQTREVVRKSGVALRKNRKLTQTIEVVKLVIVPNQKELGHAFEGDQKMVVESLLAMSELEALQMKAALVSKREAVFPVPTLGRIVTIKDNMVDIHEKRMTKQRRVFVPSVIEPSFAIDRIIHCLFEHSFYTSRSKAGDEQVNVFRFPPLVAPFPCAVFPLRKKLEYEKVVDLISNSLAAAGVYHWCSITGDTVGKTDELGVPFAITVDSDVDVPIRDRDSRDEVRVSVGKAASVVKELIDGRSSWSDICSRFRHRVRDRHKRDGVRLRARKEASMAKEVMDGRSTRSDICSRFPTCVRERASRRKAASVVEEVIDGHSLCTLFYG